MKHSFALSALIAVAAAQIPPAQLATDTAAYADPSTFDSRVQPIASAIAAINGSVVDLGVAAADFTGADQVSSLNDSANAVVTTLTDQSNNVSPLAQFTGDDLTILLPLLPNLAYLADQVNITAYNIIQQKGALVDACAGPLVFEQANNLNTSTGDFIDLVISKLPVAAQPVPGPYLAPIYAALNSAIDTFADQTALPETCSTTTTTSEPGTIVPGTSTTTTATSEPGTIVPGTSTTTTATAPVYPTGTGQVYPTPTPTKNCYRRRNRARTVEREL